MKNNSQTNCIGFYPDDLNVKCDHENDEGYCVFFDIPCDMKEMSDKDKVAELFEGLELDHLVGNKPTTLLDLRDRVWTIMSLTDVVAYEEGSGIAFLNITSDIVRNDATNNLLMIAEGTEKFLVVILNTSTYVQDIMPRD